MLQLLNQIAIPRAVGTEGNNRIIQFQKKVFENCGYSVKSIPFSCMVWSTAESWLEWNDTNQKIMASPYSNDFHGEGIARIARTLEELRGLPCEDAILFLTEEMAKEPLQPKDYPFYFPEEHKEMIDLLEEKNPLAIIAVTGKHPMCGLNPYPLFEDGNFHIPSAYMSVDEFEIIREDIRDKHVQVNIVSQCTETVSQQIYASKRVKNSKGKIVLCAHMDSKNQTQGALDNAAGIAVILKIAEILQLRNHDVDIVPFNTEEYYGANGELVYHDEIKDREDEIKLLINIDSVGHIGSKNAVSLYNIPEVLRQRIEIIINKWENTQLGEEWYAGDHMVFAFSGIPCIAITSSDIAEGGLNHTHTMEDTIQTVDDTLLVEAVSFIEELFASL